MSESNALQVFVYNGNDVRTIVKDGDPWFVATDICRGLDIKNTPDAIGKLDDDEKATIGNSDSGGRAHELWIVSEAGLYKLILKSRKPSAKKFERWITHEVLPSIRKTGSFTLDPVAQHFKDFGTRFDQNMEYVGDRLATITDTIGQMLSLVSFQGGKVSQLETGFSDVSQKLTGLGKKVDSLETKVSRFEGKLDATTPKRRDVKKEVLDRHIKHCQERFAGMCSGCGEEPLFVDGKFVGEIHHVNGRHLSDFEHTWPLGTGCHRKWHNGTPDERLVLMAAFQHYQRMAKLVVPNAEDATRDPNFSVAPIRVLSTGRLPF